MCRSQSGTRDIVFHVQCTPPWEQLTFSPPCALCCKMEEAVAVLQAHQVTKTSHKNSAVAFLQ